MEKKCTKCQRVLDVTAFNKDARGVFGVKAECRTCSTQRRRVAYHEHLTESRTVNRKKYQRYKSNIKKKPYLNAKATLAWQKRHPEKANAKTARRKTRELGQYVEDVDVLRLGERDNWICQLCFEPVESTLRGRSKRSRSIDHIIPLSAGGEHSYANTQLAHFGCNCRKNATV